MSTSFSTADLQQFRSKGISEETVHAQVERFRKGFSFVTLERAATANDGILVLSAHEIDRYQALYESEAAQMEVVKMVPASGAASRMFKDLHQFKEGDHPSDHPAVERFESNASDFAFYPAMEAQQLFDLPLHERLYELLAGPHFGFAQLPKGLIPFHHYEEGIRTAFEEHLVEAAHYLPSSENAVLVHFTISAEHLDRVSAFLEGVKPAYERRFGRSIELQFSMQKPSTDTIAVDLEYVPFRLDDGSLLFRPAGHGALLENLNDLDADVVFVKNIDNVCHDRQKANTYTYKKALAGKLIDLQKQVFDWLHMLEIPDSWEEVVPEAELFAREQLGLSFATEGLSVEERAEQLQHFFDRPIRLCGMVKNEGEPGGGPFWVKQQDGHASLQIVEKAQIDLTNESQTQILSQATHFNPVDLVCGIRDYRGEAFDLSQFTDPETGFISEKSQEGRALKALELPGLWNGAMANWISLFVEVPLSTFSPVKTVNDLLKPAHQPA